jgi:hypothetical protein
MDFIPGDLPPFVVIIVAIVAIWVVWRVVAGLIRFVLTLAIVGVVLYFLLMFAESMGMI